MKTSNTTTAPQSLFVLGPPRSGTTFLIRLTNESRIFVLLKDLVEERCFRPDLLDSRYSKDFSNFVRAHAGYWVERFYRETLARKIHQG